MLLGIGGVRALEAMGIEPGLVHLNEGHAAFVSLELARRKYSGNGSLSRRARDRPQAARSSPPTRRSRPATTPTRRSRWRTRWRRSPGRSASTTEEIISLGRTNPDEGAEPFGVTQFALRTSRAANGVSRRHGEVAREMWQAMWPEKAVDDVPITYVTNGVHIPTWLGGPMWELLNKHLGEDWLDRATDPATWAPVDDIPAKELWDVRRAQRGQLIEYVRHRAVADRLARDEPRPYAEAAANFDPDVLTVGFARRLATYKRLNLLLQDVERAMRVVAGDRPIQVLIAGKAHPRDEGGKRLVQELFSSKHAPGFAERVAYLNDYDLRMASWLVRGCDVWINLPRPPLEASGTSGMKNVMNGGLQLSVLDGWWAEGDDGHNGWSLSGDVDHDHGAQDARHAHELFRLLEEEVAPEFYRSSGDGIPRDWVARIRRSLRTLGPEFGAGRMLEDYEKKVYSRGSRAGISPSGVGSGSGSESSGDAVGVGVAVAVPSPSGVGVVSGGGVANGVGVGVTGAMPPCAARASSSLRTSSLEAVQARVELLGDVVDAVVEPILRDPPGDQEHDGHAHEHADRGAREHPRRDSAAAAEARPGSTGSAGRSPRKYARTWDRRAVEARRVNPPCLLAYEERARRSHPRTG